MTTSTFSRRGLHRPTPSTCYPPPPPPPLPYDVPCLRGTRHSVIRFRGNIQTVDTSGGPAIFAYPRFQGIAKFGNYQSEPCWFATISTPTFPIITAKLQCHFEVIIGRRWRQQFQGTWLAPDGLFKSFYQRTEWQTLTDKSVPGRANDIRWHDELGQHAVAPYFVGFGRMQWYTSGAPDPREP